MPLVLAQLKTELQTDPLALGYGVSTAVNDWQGAANVLNIVRPTIAIRRSDITASVIWEAILVSEMTALPGSPTAVQLSTERRQLAWLSGLPAIGTIRLANDDGTDTQVFANLKAIFPAGSATRTRLLDLAAQTRLGSRAEQLYGTGTIVTAVDVDAAWRLP